MVYQTTRCIHDLCGKFNLFFDLYNNMQLLLTRTNFFIDIFFIVVEQYRLQQHDPYLLDPRSFSFGRVILVDRSKTQALNKYAAIRPDTCKVRLTFFIIRIYKSLYVVGGERKIEYI